jgi:tetratricopeptide (TPR) repeat protein
MPVTRRSLLGLSVLLMALGWMFRSVLFGVQDQSPEPVHPAAFQPTPPLAGLVQESANPVATVLPAKPVKPAVVGNPAPETTQVRTLFEAGEYSRLTALLEEFEVRRTKDGRQEFAVLDGFNVFAVAQSGYEERLDAWVQHNPTRWAPWLARATYRIFRGWRARGFKLAKDTSQEQFRQMEDSFALASEDINAALRIEPRSFYAYLLLLRINRSSGDQERGVILLGKALETGPDSYLVRAYHMYLLLPRWGGSYAAMQQFSDESVRHADKNPLLQTLPGMAWADLSETVRRTDAAKAVKLAEKALTFGETWFVLYDLAWAYFRAEDYDKALQTIDRAVELYPSLPDRGLLFSPNIPDALSLRAWSLFKQQNWDAALQTLEQMERLAEGQDCGCGDARKEQAADLVNQGHREFRRNLSRASELYTLALRFDSNNSEAHCWRGIAQSRLRHSQPAYEDLRKAIELNPRLYDAYKGLDDLLLPQGRLDEIIEAWSQFLRLEPNNANAYLERAGTYHHKHDEAASMADAQKACDLGSSAACGLVKRLKGSK